MQLVMQVDPTETRDKNATCAMVRGEQVRTDDDGSVFWCSQGNELIGKDVTVQYI